jgi:hypothetical protein
LTQLLRSIRQILLSGSAFNKIKSTELAKEEKRIQRLGTFDIPDQPQGTRLYELKVRGLEGRFFGGVSTDATRYASPLCHTRTTAVFT